MPVTVTFEPLGRTVSCAEGEALFEAARREGVPIPTACVGRGTCGLCRVKVLDGEDALSPLNPIERRHLGTNYFITRLRLTCQARVVPGATAAVRVQIPDARRRSPELTTVVGPTGSKAPNQKNEAPARSSLTELGRDATKKL